MSDTKEKTVTVGGRTVRLDLDDYRRLQRRGLHRPWYVNDDGKGRDYVKHGSVVVARLILGVEGSGHVVKYRTADRLDLRRSNIYLASGTEHRERFRRDPAETAADIY